MKHTIIPLAIAILPALNLTGETLGTAAELASFLDGKPSPRVYFALTGTVTHVESKMVYVQDDSGSVDVYNGYTALTPGDKAIFNGFATFHLDGNASAQITNAAVILARCKRPDPKDCDLSALDSHALNRSFISVSGTVHDVIRDEIDPNVVFVILKYGSATLPVAIPVKDAAAAARLQDTTVRAEGIFRRRVAGHRYFFGPFLYAIKPLVAVASPPTGPFDHPRLSFYPLPTAEELYAMSKRTLTGTVLAIGRGNGVLLRADEGKIVRVDIVEGGNLPRTGERIEVVGYPTTDLFHLNLERAAYRPAGPSEPAADALPTDITAAQVFTEKGLLSQYALDILHGRLVTVTGEIKESNDIPPIPGRYMLRCPAYSLSLDTSCLPDPFLPIGATARITGIFMFENENWNPANTFPHIKGILVLPRNPADIVIISRPAWFTHRHLLAVIAVLLAGMLAILLWNRSLNRLANRRGHELAREKIKKESAQLKIGERTRLAVELHDSLSQNLEGVACQLVASRNMLKANPPSAEGCLDTAERMLDSCRLELRRCLFDLRGHALEEQNFADAIRSTLAPLCDSVDLVVRFDVRRAHFDDTTAHAILCMVRELVSNALRHGHATQIRVAGEYHDGTLSFSVRDNGCGFDAEARPGPSQGHFGLEGIRERAERLDGTAVIESHPGDGTRVAVTLHLSEGKDTEPA